MDGSDTTPSALANTSVDTSWWVAPWKFLVHTLTGVFVFGTIAAAAVGLSFAVDWLKEMKVASVIVFGLRAMEYGLFAVDVLLFSRFLFCTAREFWNQLQRP